MLVKASFLLVFFTGLCKADTLCSWLWQQTETTRMKALNSTFVTGVRDGTLHPTSFGEYVLQDIVYIYKSALSFEIAAKKLAGGTLKSFLEHKVTSSQQFGDVELKEWQLNNASAIILGNAFKSYTDHLLNVSNEYDPIYAVLVSIPCERLWPWIGEELNKIPHSYGPFAEWIGLNFDPTYKGWQDMEQWVDDMYARGFIRKDIAMKIYAESMNDEVECFNSIKP